MKTYEELLSDIEDDMELMGALHIVYAMEENGVLTGYDYLPEEPYTISVTLKDLQEKIHQQMLYDKASAYTYDSDKSAPKLAVIFPGIGYTADKPLLYYASRLARHYGYQILAVSYGPRAPEAPSRRRRLCGPRRPWPWPPPLRGQMLSCY